MFLFFTLAIGPRISIEPWDYIMLSIVHTDVAELHSLGTLLPAIILAIPREFSCYC